jgi:PAS domain S-box-containing protein
MRVLDTPPLNMFRIEAKMRLQPGTLEGANYAVMITNRAGIIAWVNRAFTRLTGFSGTEAIGYNPSALIKSGEQEPSFYRELWATILRGRVWRGEMINRRKDGSLYTEAQTITAVKDSAGEITHFVAIKRDLIAEGAEAALPMPAAEAGLNAVGLETILVVEGDVETRHRTTRMLRSAGYRVLAASSAAGALALLDYHRGRVDLLFIGVAPGGRPGSEVAEAILAARPDVDVLYASGSTGHRLFARNPQSHVAEVIRKPYTSLGLIRKVRDILDLRRCMKIA